MQIFKIFVFLNQCKLFHFSRQGRKTIMKIAYYMPFKPLGHIHPSGDLVTGTELYSHLAEKGHTITLASKLRCRWIYFKPLSLLRLLVLQRQIVKRYTKMRPDLWLSYHSYYKAPDLLGSLCARKLGIPYVIFQGIYSTKRKKQIKTLPGFLLNKRVLQAADHIFTNKKRDLRNLLRIIPEQCLSYIAPGIQPKVFQFSPTWRTTLRELWGMNDETVIMTAAMMRPGVKTEGIAEVIKSCSELVQRGLPIKLVIAGDGSCHQQLKKMASELLPDRTIFLGQIPRPELNKYYSGADIFAFPGREESLGMVYLEAQSCRLPVVAYGNWGAGEAVIHGQTGLLSPVTQPLEFTNNIQKLIENPARRRQLSREAERHIQQNHDLDQNYSQLEKKLFILTGKDKQ